MPEDPNPSAPVPSPSQVGPFHLHTIVLNDAGHLTHANVPSGNGIVSPSGIVVAPGGYVLHSDVIEALRRMPPSWTTSEAADWFAMRRTT